MDNEKIKRFPNERYIYKSIHKINIDVLTLTEVFVNQKWVKLH